MSVALTLVIAVPVFAAAVSTPAPRPSTWAAPWPAPAHPLRLTVAAGLTPERTETLIHHVHSHLDVFVNGKHIRVPAGIGIDIHNPGVHVFAIAGRIESLRRNQPLQRGVHLATSHTR